MQLFYFSSLPEMVATSDLAIERTVQIVVQIAENRPLTADEMTTLVESVIESTRSVSPSVATGSS
jgi:hypothetical protein